MAATVLGNVIEFFNRIGIYDVVLPFLLVFTIVFAIFERTKVLGTEKIDGEVVTKKNLNAMAAFVIAFFVVASGQVVETITKVSANMVVLLFLVIFFLMLVGTLYKEGEFVEKGLEGWPRNVFIIVLTLGIILVFLDGIKAADGRSWLQVATDYLQLNWSSPAVASVVLILLVIFIINWLTKGK
ncbi:MAG: hypothetical protein QW559_02170 [Candidatus Woesearchaeota archaeon]